MDVELVPGAADWTELPYVAEDLAKVIDESDGDLTIEDLRVRLAAGLARLWMVWHNSRYTGVVVEERGERRLHLVAVRLRYTGVLGSVLDFFRREATGSGLGLSCSSRRPGMGRLLGKYGWTPRFVEFIAP